MHGTTFDARVRVRLRSCALIKQTLLRREHVSEYSLGVHIYAQVCCQAEPQRVYRGPTEHHEWWQHEHSQQAAARARENVLPRVARAKAVARKRARLFCQRQRRVCVVCTTHFYACTQHTVNARM